MQAKNDKIYDISAELDTLYEKEGTEERAKFDNDAWNFYRRHSRVGTTTYE